MNGKRTSSILNHEQKFSADDVKTGFIGRKKNNKKRQLCVTVESQYCATAG